KALFLGRLTGRALAACYGAADVFVFPSRTDTFGLVLLEALASGLPVAGYPVTGPLDIVGPDGPGVLDEDLAAAARAALAIPRERCREWAMSYDWETCVTRFTQLLRPIGTASAAARPAPLATAAFPEGR
ncbi:MAG TPA: glycosyltransferase, partial [Arenibaculum sp.]|nr:glycosyltransferase [Arenibaculum sp.]